MPIAGGARWRKGPEVPARVEQRVSVAGAHRQRIVPGKEGRAVEAISMAACKETAEIAGQPPHRALSVRVRVNRSDEGEGYRAMYRESPRGQGGVS